MNHVQFETNGVRVLAIPVKKRWDIAGIGGDSLFYWPTKASRNIGDYPYSISINKGDWEIHAISTDLTEEQLEAILPLTHKYRRFSHLMEILRSHGIDPTAKYVILIERK